MDRVLELGDPDYPARLLELADPPAVLYLRGALFRASPSVAIVGTREASELGRDLTRAMAEELARAGVTVVSGGAFGIDAAAHGGAVRAGRPTVVVLPTALTHPSPRAHRALFEAVLEVGGAWVSEQDGPALESHFRTRNRLIAALADLVVVVEARLHSGTRHTVRAARALGRPLAAVPWSPGDPRGGTCLELLSAGAHTVTSARDVLALLGLPRPRRARAARRDDPDAPLDWRVVEAVRRGADTLDALTGELSVDVAPLLGVVTELEVAGVLAGAREGRLVVARALPCASPRGGRNLSRRR